MSNAANETEQLRATYRAIRAACVKARGVALATFDEDARRGAIEYSDGEEVTPYCWVMGAHYVAEDLGVEVP